MQRNIALVLLFLLGLVLVRESRQGYATSYERLFSDWLARNSELQSKDAPLALIEINDASLSNSRTWPLPPLDYALFLRAGLVFEPSLLAIEEVLSWPEEAKGDSPDQNRKILHEQTLRCPKLLLSAQLGFPSDPDLLPPLQNVPAMRHATGDSSRLSEFPIVERQPLEELRLSTPIGFTNLPANESPARRVPLIFRYCGQVVPSFVLQSAMLWLQLTPDDIHVEIGSYIHMGDKLNIPIDDSGMMNVDFNSRFARMGLEDLLLVVSQIESERKPLVSPDSLKDKVLLLARSDSASRTLRFPTGKAGSSGELFASAIATIQNGEFSLRAPLGADLLIIAGVLVLSGFFSKMNASGAIWTAVMLVPIYLMTAIGVFATTLIWLPIVLPLGLLAFAVIFRLVAISSGKAEIESARIESSRKTHSHC